MICHPPHFWGNVSVALLCEAISFKKATDQSRRERGTGNKAASVLCESAHRPFFESFMLPIISCSVFSCPRKEQRIHVQILDTA